MAKKLAKQMTYNDAMNLLKTEEAKIQAVRQGTMIKDIKEPQRRIRVYSSLKMGTPAAAAAISAVALGAIAPDFMEQTGNFVVGVTGFATLFSSILARYVTPAAIVVSPKKYIHFLNETEVHNRFKNLKTTEYILFEKKALKKVSSALKVVNEYLDEIGMEMVYAPQDASFRNSIKV